MISTPVPKGKHEEGHQACKQAAWSGLPQQRLSLSLTGSGRRARQGLLVLHCGPACLWLTSEELVDVRALGRPQLLARLGRDHRLHPYIHTFTHHTTSLSPTACLPDPRASSPCHGPLSVMLRPPGS